MNIILALLICCLVCIYAKDTLVDVSNITQAIRAAEDGDVLILKSGTYPNLNYTMYGISLSFISESGNPDDVIMDGNGNNDWGPFMIYHDASNDTLPAGLRTTLFISGMTFTNCGSFIASPNYFGGAIYVDTENSSDASVTIKNSKFEGGFSSNGGSIFVWAYDAPITLSISNTSFHDVEAYVGASVMALGATVEITNCSFESLNSLFYGGIFISAGGVLALSDSILTKSTGPGAALAVAQGSFAIVSNVIVSDNVGDDEGAFYTEGNITVINSTFANNRDIGAGGAIFAVGGRLIIADSTFDSNSATVNGGGLYALASSVFVSNSNFTGNSANVGGGAIFIGSFATITGCNFFENTAEDGAGLTGSNSTVVVEDCLIQRNRAVEFGGGIVVTNKATFNLNGTTISDNLAISGSSLFCYGGIINLANVNISSSIEDKHGVFCDNSNFGTSCVIATTDTPGDWNDVCIERPLTSANPNSGGHKIEPWGIALIVIFVIIAVAAIAGVIVYSIRKKKQNSTSFGRM